MADNSYTVEAVLKADTSSFTSNIKSAGSAVEEFTNNAKTKLGSVGDKFEKVGSSLSKKLTAPIVAGVGASIKTFTSFDDSMRKVAATSGIAADSSSKSYMAMRKQAQDLGATTRYSASEVAEGMNYMAMAGWSAEQTMAGIPAVLDLAAASGENLGTTSDIVTDAMTAFGMQAEQAGEFADILAAASSNANTNVSMMGDTFKYVAPVAGSLGFNAKDTAIAIGLMANSGIKGSQAGTALRAGLVNLVHPSEAAQKAMDALGISVTDSEGNMKSFRTIMGDLREKMGGLSETQKASAAATIFGKEAMSGWLAIINSSDKDFNKLSNAIDNSNGATKRMVGTMEGGIGGAFRNLKSAIEGLGIAIGERLAPYIEKAAKYITDLAQKFKALSPAQQDTIIKIALVVAAIGPLLIAISKVFKAIKTVIDVVAFLSNPFNLAIVAIIAAVAAFVYFYTHSEKFRTIVNNAINSVIKAWDKLKEAWSTAKEWAGNVWNGMKEVISNAIEGIKATWSGIKESFMNAWNGITEWFSNLWNGIKQAPSNAVESIKNMWSSVKDFFSNLWNGITQIFSTVWQTIQAAVLPIIQPFIDIMLSYWQNLSTSFSQIWDGVKQVFQGAWEIIKAIVMGPVLIICDLITGNFGKVGSDLQLIWQSITTGVSTAWNGVLGILSGIWNAILAAGQVIWQTMATSVTTIVNGLVSGVVGLWNGLQSAVVSIASAIANGAISAWNSLTSGVSSLVSGFVGTITGLWNGLSSGVIGIARGLVSGAVGAFNGLVGGVSSIVSSVSGVLNSLGNINLAGAGAAIMNGFLGGLQSAWGAVQNFVGGIADWIRAHKGPISYDRVLLRPAGQAIMQGLNEGLNDMFGQVQNTVRNVTAIFEDFNPTQTVTLGVESNTKAITDNIQDFQSQLRSNIADFNAQIADMMTNNYSYQFEYGKYSNNIEVTYKNQEGEKLEVIKEALATVRSAVSRDTVLNIDGREFARATGDDISDYQSRKQEVRNLVWGLGNNG
nr:MAG TPA: minor tail protein [Caudoviricetes sp.]